MASVLKFERALHRPLRIELGEVGVELGERRADLRREPLAHASFVHPRRELDRSHDFDLGRFDPGILAGEPHRPRQGCTGVGGTVEADDDTPDRDTGGGWRHDHDRYRRVRRALAAHGTEDDIFEPSAAAAPDDEEVGIAADLDQRGGSSTLHDPGVDRWRGLRAR
jgi:hypothetical protein